MNHLTSLNVLQIPPNLLKQRSLRDLTMRPVAGAIHSQKEVWKILFPQDQFIKDLIPRRLSLPLIQWPIQRIIPSPPLPSITVDTEVRKLLSIQAAQKTGFPKKGKHFVQRMFDIPKKRSATGERRPILDCRPLNKYLQTYHFKMEGLNTVKELLQPGDWMTSIDLKSAYLQVGINQKHQPLLTFQWRDQFIHFTTLPFGVNIAPRVFSKLMRRAVQLVRQMGVRIVYYLDDTLILARSPEEAIRHTALWALVLTELGFVINWEKSQLTPIQKSIFLGTEIDSIKMSLSLPEEKIQRILNFCQKLINSPLSKRYKTKELASYLGILNSTSECFAPGKMFTHFLHKDLMKALDKGWTTGQSPLSLEAREELQWWLEHLQCLNGQPIQLQKTAPFRLQTDASSHGWGGVLFQPNQYQTYVQGLWDPKDQAKSNNVREMTAAVLSLEHFLPRLGQWTKPADRLLLIESDNTTTVSTILRKGSTTTSLNKLAIRLWKITQRYQFRIIAAYLPGLQNEIADGLSRTHLTSLTESRLHPAIFAHIDRNFGPLQVDLFASPSNHQLPRFVSWKGHPRSWRVDAFSLDWTRLEGAYLNPPLALIARCLNKIIQDRATMVLIAPVWPAQPWWPTLLRLAKTLPIVLPSLPNLFTDPRGRAQCPGWTTAAWYLSGDNLKDEVSPIMRLIQSSSPGKMQGTMIRLGTVGSLGPPKTETVSALSTLLQKQILFLT